MPTLPSRLRFDRYRQQVQQRNRSSQDVAATASPHASRHAATRPTVRTRGFAELLAAFWSLLGRQRSVMVAALAILTVAILLKLVPPYGTKLVIDSVLTAPPRPLPALLTQWFPATWNEAAPLTRLVAIAAMVVVVTLVATAISLTARWTATRCTNHAAVAIRRRVFDHAIGLPLQQVQEMKAGGVSSLIREDAGAVADLIFSLLYNPWRAIVQFVGSLIVLALVDWKLMLGGLMLLPVVWVTHRTWINRIRPLHRDIRTQRQSIDAAATETFAGIRVVRTFARRRSESSRFVREGNYLVRQQLFTWWWTRGIELIWEIAIPLASSFLLLYGGYRIIQAELTLGELMMFLVYLTMLLDPIATLASSAATFQTNLAALDRILDVMQQPGEFPENPHAVSLRHDQVRGQITISGVEFAYPGTERPVLHDIDLDVAAGQTVALVGRSGSGKTTLTNLIARFYDPSAGTIQIDGIDLRDIRPESYRNLLGIVEQDVFLFDGTIRENILYARRDAGEADLIAASRAAAADDFIRQLPDGYDTLIGERGFKLSGGQRQRIAIARALLADPKVLILDEATSNLDSESERLIQRSLEQLLKNRTAFVIAHRLSTIRSADLIVVIDDGRILQIGNHDQLMQQPGRYRDMVTLQTAPELTGV